MRAQRLRRSIWRMGLLGVVAMPMASVPMGIAIPRELGAQVEHQVRRLTFTSVSAEQDGKGWVVRVTGKAPAVPQGTKVDFELTWRSQLIESFEVVIEGADFSAELKPKRALVTPDDFVWRTSIRPEKQSPTVRRTLERDAENFPPGSTYWVDYHFDHPFKLATAAEVEAELGDLRTFFVERFTNLAKLDRSVRDKVQAVQAGTDMVQGGKFAADQWRKWFAKDVLAPIRKIQEEITKSHEVARFAAFRHTLELLNEVSRGVAKRALGSQQDLFREKQVELPEEDKVPKDLDTETRRRRVSDRELNQLIEEIRKQLGLQEEPAPPAPPPAEKE